MRFIIREFEVDSNHIRPPPLPLAEPAASGIPQAAIRCPGLSLRLPASRVLLLAGGAVLCPALERRSPRGRQRPSALNPPGAAAGGGKEPATRGKLSRGK